MKRYLILLLLTFQFLFSQEIVVKGNVLNSGKFNDRVVYIVKNDTINKQKKHNNSLYANWKKNTKFENQKEASYQEVTKSDLILDQLLKNKNYRTYSDSLGNFEIKAKLSDSLFFESYWHTTEKYLVADLVKKKKINIKLKLEPCEVWPSHPEKPTKLYVFIGKKIKIWESPSSYCNVGTLNSRVLSKYLVVENIYGDFKKDTIQFTTYPTHSSPIQQNYSPFKTSFTEYDYCLLYVLEYKGELIQTGYVFDDVYMTKEGKWASPLKPKGLYNTISADLFKPKKINFITPIEFEFEDVFFKQIKENFPEDYTKISDGKITVEYGYYVEDLFEIRKSGLLKQYDYLINNNK
ncbi:hypothetical protein [Flavobacterium reichenbachii]|uniref:Uncharacterized protein n=1 Tax=Flavobacterium reichenbachii TaxID=362418 RepID=A0A085ZS45_9FLAO|nr:hypothetical protein [Flavobacterium reichenbachii]KFF07259.1 hypothetical protein IW19_17870 [Flavobacterium reichenbachii]OXB13252.1 hypothetical protein B0A68_15950 [Flavobacterium reichenbachii]